MEKEPQQRIGFKNPGGQKSAMVTYLVLISRVKEARGAPGTTGEGVEGD